MSRTKGTEEEPTRAATVRLKGKVHGELSAVSDQSGLAISKLLELGVGLLLEQVRLTGRVPLPELKLESRSEGADAA